MNKKIDPIIEKLINKKGFIEVICGPMFSCKTTKLIKIIHFFNFYSFQFLVFKPFLDNRYSYEKKLINHCLESAPAILIKKSKEIYNFIKKDVDLIIIDEVQFLDNEIEKIVNYLSYQGIRFILAGLDLDFRGCPFGSMPYLLSIADHITKCSSYCYFCGKEATRTQRIKNKNFKKKESIILVGNNKDYQPCCRKCHKI
ncbi:MAG: thymidine kinase [Candidatus Phytoplasma stylosanthis]|nr:thymidine kinase [Candidatus Phytoplasma stylosanthis]